jgi:DNA-binding NarL/FixJ family response regulator
VDDHPIIRHGMAQLIDREQDLQVSGQAGGMAEALSAIKDADPDLVLVDLSLGDSGGIELIKELKARESPAKVMVVSMHDETTYAERAIRAGAMGYITKDAPNDELLTAIRQVLRGKIYLNAEMSDQLLHRVLEGDDTLGRSPIEKLSDRELEVFDLIGQGLRTSDIADRLCLSRKTIETYRENIKDKLDLRDSTELVHHAIRWKLDRDGG